MKKVYILLQLICILCLCSCKYCPINEIQDEFSKYHRENDIVLEIGKKRVYFNDYDVGFNYLIPKEEASGGIYVTKDKIYFSTYKEYKSIFDIDYALNIYSSNLKGENIELVFSKSECKTLPWTVANDHIFYFKDYLDGNTFAQNSRVIYSYNLITGEYKTVASGKDYDINDFLPKNESNKYQVEMTDKFIITLNDTNEQRTIDDAFLNKTEYIDSMKKFGYKIRRYDILDDRLFLTYQVGECSWDGTDVPHLVFEYDFDKDIIKYQLLVFPYDFGHVRLKLIKDNIN